MSVCVCVYVLAQSKLIVQGQPIDYLHRIKENVDQREREREREREGVAHFVEVAFEKIQKYNDGDMVKNKWETSGVRREP